jgi:hypothetical protein
MEFWKIMLVSLLGLGGCVLGGGDEEVGNAELALVGSGPCAALGQIADACPADEAWRNHGQYVSCTARYLERRWQAGDITEEQKDALQAAAAESDVGKRHGGAGPSFVDALGDTDADGTADVCEAAPTEVVPVPMQAAPELGQPLVPAQQ